MNSEITIVDYGVGNLGSVENMLHRLAIPARISRDPDEVATAPRLILPGVGAFDAGMRNLTERRLDIALHAAAGRGTPILGVCLGMQLLTNGSEEGRLPGLGLIAGQCQRFRTSQSPPLKVPHMGWAEVETARPNLLLPQGERRRFYFVHSYHVVCDHDEDITARAVYGAPFVAAVERGSVFGAQFHPEKSHRFGMALFRTFATA